MRLPAFPLQRNWPAPLLVVAAIIGYALVVLLSLKLTVKPDQMISIWLPDGIAIAVIVLTRRSRWLVIGAVLCVVHFAANLIFGNGVAGALLFTLANLCEITVGAALILLTKRKELMNGIPGVIRDIVPATLIAPVTGAAIMVAVSGGGGQGNFRNEFEQWYVAEALGLYIMLPFCLAFTPERLRHLVNRSETPRFFAMVVSLLALVLLARSQLFPPVLFLNLMLVISALLLPLLGSLLVNALCVVVSSWFLQAGVVVGMPVFHPGFDPARYLALALCVAPSVLVAVLLESLRNTERQLIDASDRARQSEAAKAMFLAVMSHEIRSPLNSIIGFASLLWEKEQSGRNRELIEPIRTAGQILLSVINDILDYSKFESGRLELEEISFSPEACVQEIEILLAERARESGLNFRAVVDDNVPATLIGDAHRLRQVLINLVSNAIKFTTQGEVEVRVKADAGGTESRRLKFTVRDTGIGIPAEQSEKVFERFAQVDSSTARRFGGTGLGLAISKSVARAMGGKLWFESKVGEGTTFHFQVSFRQPANSASKSARDAALPQRMNPVSEQASRLRILVVDDNKINSRLASLLLKRIGVSEVSAVNDGRTALEVVRSGGFDVVLMDCQMPIMDGFQTARKIREMEAAAPDRSRLFVVALTAAVFPEDRKKAFDAGMDDFLEKPVNQAALAETLERASVRTQSV